MAQVFNALVFDLYMASTIHLQFGNPAHVFSPANNRLLQLVDQHSECLVIDGRTRLCLFCLVWHRWEGGGAKGEVWSLVVFSVA